MTELKLRDGALRPLDEILSNWAATWDPALRTLLRAIDPDRWEESGGSPVAMRKALTPSRLPRLDGDGEFRRRLADAEGRLKALRAGSDSFFARHRGGLPGGIAYFSAEFGIHEGLPIYSGGLGVLAGDHVKSASDLGIPFVAVGLFYRDGYFRQRIAHGAQVEEYDARGPADLGLERATGAGGQPLEVYVPLYDRNVRAEVFVAQVGRVQLLLLDTDVSPNLDEDRWLTRRLYGGDKRTRLGQEIVLGIGGVRALRGMGLRPDVFHLNEGHTAFVILERLREEVHAGRAAEDALAAVRASAVFTTHTPVPAGHDRFEEHLVEEMMGTFRQQLGLSPVELMDMGRVVPGSTEELCMTVLALKGTRAANGVSEKHGEVSRSMWAGLWPRRSARTVPIGHITNGVHAPSWLGDEVRAVLDAAVPRLGDALVSGEKLDLSSLPDEALWAAHNAQKERLLRLVRWRTGREIPADALVLGFARRFAPYKRGDLLLSDTDRLRALLTDPRRPCVVLYGGKSHPRDRAGKDIIARVLRATDNGFAGRVIFLEDYDIGLGRALTQGADVWINNPRRPLEASGTSGQKVAMNGGLNCSTLDGWWLEAYREDPRCGFSVGPEQPSADEAHGDAEDGRALHDVLANEIAPLYWDRGRDAVPRPWTKRMKAAIALCLPRFNTDRMVREYLDTMYLPGR
jgi:starch phosphorylase